MAQRKPCSQYPHSKGEASLPCSWVATQCQQLPVIIHDQARPVVRAQQQGLLRLHYPSLQPKLEGQTIDTQAQRCTLTPMSQTTRLLNKGWDLCGHGNLQPVFKISTVCLWAWPKLALTPPGVHLSARCSHSEYRHVSTKRGRDNASVQLLDEQPLPVIFHV